MTTGLKTPSNYYLQLINNFPPRPINNEAELLATQEQIDTIIDKPDITQDDRDYLRVLGTLVYEYEQKHEPMPILREVELIQALMVEKDLHPQDLVPIFGDKSTVNRVLARKQELTGKQINQLSDFFQISPTMFLVSKV